MKKIIASLFSLLILYSCSKRSGTVEKAISDSGKEAESPYLTTDNKGNPVLCWSEKLDTNQTWQQCFAVYDKSKGEFGKTITLPPVKDMAVHAEGMPRLSFKKNGSIIAAYQSNNPTPKNEYASKIFFVQSNDGGKSWSEPKLIHRDTSSATSHSFFDMAELSNGEIGIVWLDEQTDTAKYKYGRPVKFAVSDGNNGFINEKTIEETACECCRVNVIVDRSSNIHVVFRDMFADSSRDMSHCVSTDGGNTFSPAKKIADDQWRVNACPHAGPSISAYNGELSAVWYTGKENEQGSYIATSSDGMNFTNKTLLDQQALHPQIAYNTSGNAAIVWQQSIKNGSDNFFNIVMKIKNQSKGNIISKERIDSINPVLISADDKFIIAWEEKEGTQSKIIYKIIED